MKRTVPILWYENAAGEKWWPPAGFCDPHGHPPGYIYQWFRNPCELHESVCRVDEGSSSRIGGGSSTWDPDLVTNMVRPTLRTRIRQVLRSASFVPLFALDEAIVIAATSCERCMNVLHWRYATGHGYPPWSPQFRETNTSCEHCVPPAVAADCPTCGRPLGGSFPECIDCQVVTALKGGPADV